MVSIAVCDDDREYINDVERHISQYFAENGLVQPFHNPKRKRTCGKRHRV